MIFLALIYLAFISLGLPDSLLGSSWPFMQVELGVPIANAGYISVIISGSTIFSSLFSHKLVRSMGTGRLMVVSVTFTAAALLGFSVSPSFAWLMACAIFLGLGAGAVDSGLNEFMAEHYSAMHMNWLHCFWGIGAMLGPVLVSVLAKQGYGWRSGYMGMSVVQFVLIGLLLFSLPIWRRYETPVPPGQQSQHAAEGTLLAPLRSKGAGLAMLIFFLYTAIESSTTLWGASYLVRAKGLAPENAAGWITMFFLGITAGRGLSGFAAKKLSNEALIRIGLILMLAGFLVMLLPLPVVYSCCALLLIGLGLAPVFPAMLHQTPVYFEKGNAQAAMGLQMACAYTGTTLMPPLFGQLFSHVSFHLLPWVLLAFGVGLFASATRLRVVARKRSLPPVPKEESAVVECV